MTTSSAGKVRDRLPAECYDMLREFFTKVSKLPTRKQKEELVRKIQVMSGRQDYNHKVLEGWFSNHRRTEIRRDGGSHLDASQCANLETLCKELPHDPAKRLVPTWAKMMKADENLIRSWVEYWYQSKGLPTPEPEPEPEPEQEMEAKREEEEVDELLMDEEEIVPPTPQPPPPRLRIELPPAPLPVPQPPNVAHPTPPTPPMNYTPLLNRIVPPPTKATQPTAAPAKPNYYRDQSWKNYTLPGGVVLSSSTSRPPPPPTPSTSRPGDFELMYAIGKAALPKPKAPTPLSRDKWDTLTDPVMHRMQTFLNRVKSGELESQGWTPDMAKSKN